MLIKDCTFHVWPGRVRAYLSGEITLDQLHEECQAAHLRGPAEGLAADVLRIIGEGTSADWSLDTYRTALRDALRNHGWWT